MLNLPQNNEDGRAHRQDFDVKASLGPSDESTLGTTGIIGLEHLRVCSSYMGTFVVATRQDSLSCSRSVRRQRLFGLSIAKNSTGWSSLSQHRSRRIGTRIESTIIGHCKAPRVSHTPWYQGCGRQSHGCWCTCARTSHSF
jgi:hypothetical protein